LRTRRDAMRDALARHLTGTATWSEPEGGYFLWVDLPADSAELLRRAEAEGVSFVKGSDFFPDGSGAQSARLAFSYASSSEIEEGVSVLSTLLRA
jgi:2-aminoadipate transaminase